VVAAWGGVGITQCDGRAMGLFHCHSGGGVGGIVVSCAFDVGLVSSADGTGWLERLSECARASSVCWG